MSPWRAVDTATHGALLTGIAHLDWDWSVGDLATVVDHFGWRLVKTVQGAGAIADAGFGIDGKEITIGFDSDRVTDLTISLTETVTPPTDRSRAFLQDVFAAVASDAMAALGEPTRRVFGEKPAIEWRGPRHTVTIDNLAIAVVLTWETNEHHDRWNAEH